MNQKKNYTCSLLRVIGTFMIVLCHIIGYYKFIPGSEFLGIVLGGGVEVFFLISGIQYYNKNIGNYGKWSCRQFVKLQVPTMIWVIVWICVLLILNIPVNAVDGVYYLFSLQGLRILSPVFAIPQLPGLEHLWFLTFILICYLFVPFINKAVKSNKRHLFFFVLLVASIALALIKVRFAYIFCFVLGFYVKRYEKFLNSKSSLFLFSFIIIISSGGMLLLKKYFDGSAFYNYLCWMTYLILLSIWLYCLCGTVTKLPIVRKIIDTSVFVACEKLSFYVYIVHHSFAKGSASFYANFGLLAATGMFIVATILSSIALYFVDKKLKKFFKH